jgi:hypothetical protein
MLTLQKGVRSTVIGTSHVPDWFTQGIQQKTLVTCFSVNLGNYYSNKFTHDNNDRLFFLFNRQRFDWKLHCLWRAIYFLVIVLWTLQNWIRTWQYCQWSIVRIQQKKRAQEGHFAFLQCIWFILYHKGSVDTIIIFFILGTIISSYLQQGRSKSSHSR